MTALVFDTETTGIPKHPTAKDEVQPRIIEWGGVLVDESGEVLDELDVIINPGVKLEAVITKITGLTDEDLAGQPRFVDVAAQLRRFFERADLMIAHNLPFDRTMMTLDLARAGITDWPWPGRSVCTVQEHAEEWGYRPNLKKLYEWYFSEPLAQKHRALDDVHALARVAIAAGVVK